MYILFFQKFGQVVRSLLPVETTLFFLLLGALVWPIPYIGAVSPNLAIIAIFYWAIYRPDLLRPVIVFVFGLLNDAIHYLPSGLSAYIFLGIYQLAFSYRKFFVGQIFYMLWSGFALIALLAMIVYWCGFSLYEQKVVALVPVVLQYVMTVVLFPLPAWILIRLQRKFLSQR